MKPKEFGKVKAKGRGFWGVVILFTDFDLINYCNIIHELMVVNRDGKKQMVVGRFIIIFLHEMPKHRYIGIGTGLGLAFYSNRSWGAHLHLAMQRRGPWKYMQDKDEFFFFFLNLLLLSCSCFLSLFFPVHLRKMAKCNEVIKLLLSTVDYKFIIIL